MSFRVLGARLHSLTRLGFLGRSPRAAEAPVREEPQELFTPAASRAGGRGGPKDPPTLPIPQALEFIRSAQAVGMSNEDINHEITHDYITFGKLLQAILDPRFDPTAAEPVSQLHPNWFSIALYVSNMVGHAIGSARAARETVDLLEEKGDLDPQLILDRFHLPELFKPVAEAFEIARFGTELPHGLAAIFAAMVSANVSAYAHPETGAITAKRLLELYQAVPGSTPLDKARALFDTIDRMLGEGNQAVYADMGGGMERYLQWRQAHPNPTPEDVLERFSAEVPLPQADPATSRALYDFALAHAADQPQPSDYSQLCPTAANGGSLLVASFAIYEQAARTEDPDRRNQLIDFANAFLAFREQRDLLQPVFERQVPGEVDRMKVWQLLTPAAAVNFGPLRWLYEEYLEAHPEARLGARQPLVDQKNWGNFEDRWVAILSAFAEIYRNPRITWTHLPKVEPPPAIPGAA